MARRRTTSSSSFPHHSFSLLPISCCCFFFFFFLFSSSSSSSSSSSVAFATSPGSYSSQQQPLNPGNFSFGPAANTVPAFPVVQMENQTCHLDLSDELFGGVGQACGRTLDRSRCCPVLAAWLFAAHARSALELHPSQAVFQPDSDLTPMMPDDSQKCVDSLQTSLRGQDIFLARPNSSCDAVLCFCGIRLHQIGSLRCPAAFNLSLTYRNATPTAAVKDLEKNCRNSSYSGCSRCLQSLDKLKVGVNNGSSSNGGGGDRAIKMFGRDCQLMALTWLLARNKTAYIPTVSAVLRAIMYSAHPTDEHHAAKCSPDQENMPLAVDSLQFEKHDNSSSIPLARPLGFTTVLLFTAATAFLPFLAGAGGP